MAPSTDPLDAAVAVLPGADEGGGLGDVEEASGRGLLEGAAGSVAVRRRAEVAELVVAAQWVVLHGQPRDERDPMITPGGEGTPSVREYCLPELALARGEHALRTRSLVADVLDLQHRLPLTWAQVVSGGAEPWVARRVAGMTRKLGAGCVGVVDRAVARAIAGHAPSTVLEIAAAKVIEADPETHAMERERERHARYVTLSRADEFGFRHVIARVTAGDAMWVDALVDRVADILAAEHGGDHNRDELRSLAFGWLARPVDLLKLLLDHTTGDLGDESDRATGEIDRAAEAVCAGDAALFQVETADQPDEPADRVPERPRWAPEHLAETAHRLASMTARQLAALRGRGVVFVHVTDKALFTQAGIVRVEAQGPVLVQSLAELLGHADIHVKQVIDHRITRRVDAYEHPETVKDHAWTSAGGDVFPYSPRTATRCSVDFDHATPFVPPETGGPPGQTGPHNSGPLRRRHHRWKTHGGFRCRQAGPGRHLWQTPHGLSYLVDHTGTHRLTDDDADLILTAPPGLDIHLGPRLLLQDA